MKPFLRALVGILMAAVLAATPSVVAQEVEGDATLLPSSGRITYGQTLRLDGEIRSDARCASDREVHLEARAYGAETWEELDQTTSGADGSFSFQLVPASTSGYRARVPPATVDAQVCAEAISGEAPVEVRAVVSTSISRREIPAGGCTRVRISVLPPRPGAEVRLEQRRSGEWRTVHVEALDEASRADATACYGWGAIKKTFRLRGLWPGDELNLRATGPVHEVKVVKAKWMRRLDRITRGLPMGVSVRDDGGFLYRRADSVRRTPASNQKLLLSMALLDRLGSDVQLRTSAAAAEVSDGVIPGDLWIRGTGDPTMGKSGLDLLARRIAAAGVTHVRGRVMGSTAYFSRDWFAPGWKSSFPRRYVALPSALTFEGNRHRGRHIRNPEQRAARWLTKRLRVHGLRVDGTPGAGRPPSGLTQVAEVRSPAVAALLRRMNRSSLNFDAEVLGKRLGRERHGSPGSIAKGASAISGWAAAGGGATAYDASGLSYANRVTPVSLARLLGIAEQKPWGKDLRASLPRPGEGTLSSRLGGVRVRAKTGTLSSISALSGYVWSDRRGSWVEFSIVSGGLSKARAVAVEDRIVRILARSAR